MRNWYHTTGIFSRGDEDDLALNIKVEEDFCFDMNEVGAYNRSEDGWTCIWMNSGSIVIKVPYDQFKQEIDKLN